MTTINITRKIPRFITEYANYRIACNNQLLKDFKHLYKADTIQMIQDENETIKKAVKMVSNGRITINEAMRIINEA